MLKIGQRVAVFDDPILQKTLEGEAIITEIVNFHGKWNGQDVVLCEVKFDGENEAFPRAILDS